MDVEISAPQENSGDIMGDLNSRRGRVQGMDTIGKNQVIKAQVPMSEMLNYQSTLNSITGCARIVSHAVFTLRSGAGQSRAKGHQSVES